MKFKQHEIQIITTALNDRMENLASILNCCENHDPINCGVHSEEHVQEIAAEYAETSELYRIINNGSCTGRVLAF